MKKVLKYFVIGVIVLTLLMGTAIGETITKTIEVVYNQVNITVNGTKINADNILYNGTTYVPLRAVSEALGKEVGWDQATNTASINDKATGGTITVDQIPYEIKILEPDSIGTVYMQATYTNNTNYPITGISMDVLLKDSNTITYLMNYDTVMPGETSPLFESFGPSTRDEKDYQILTISVQAENKNGKTIYMEYDTKLNKYDYSEY